MPASNAVIFGGPHDGKVVVLPEGMTAINLQEPQPDPNTPNRTIMVTVRYEVTEGEDRQDGYGRIRLLRNTNPDERVP